MEFDNKEILDKLQRLRNKKNEWATLSIQRKVELLTQSYEILKTVKDEWLRLCCEAKGLDPSLEHEEITAGIYPTTRMFRLIIETLKPAAAAEASGRPIELLPPPFITERNGQKIVNVYPANLGDKLLFPGIIAENYIMPGHEVSQGTEFLEAKKNGAGQVSLVLGAGNQSSIPFMDSLFKLFNQNQVVFLKHNPVAEWLSPIIEKVMKPFIDLDYFHHTTGGADVGKFLCQECDNVHITGSDKTHDAIVWNGKDKHTNPPEFHKEITSELGCVTPVIIVPGDWTVAEIDYVAQHIAGSVVNNNSYNCNASKLLIVQKSWNKRESLINAIKNALSTCRPRYAYYPGTKERYEAYKEKYPEHEEIGEGDENHFPWLLIRNVPAEKGEYALCHEPFAPVLSEIVLDEDNVKDFLSEATRICNEKIWGNLSMSIFVDPKTEAENKEYVEKAIDELEYGGIAVNSWAGTIYALVTPVWGAYPGNEITDIQSGRGFVHNSYMLDNVQKAVIRVPFMLLFASKFPYFPNHKNPRKFSESLLRYEQGPGIVPFLMTMWNALWG